MWKEPSWPYMTCYPTICLEGLTRAIKTSSSIIGAQARFEVQHLRRNRSRRPSELALHNSRIIIIITYCQVYEWQRLYLHSAIRLHEAHKDNLLLLLLLLLLLYIAKYTNDIGYTSTPQYAFMRPTRTIYYYYYYYYYYYILPSIWMTEAIPPLRNTPS